MTIGLNKLIKSSKHRRRRRGAENIRVKLKMRTFFLKNTLYTENILFDHSGKFLSPPNCFALLRLCDGWLLYTIRGGYPVTGSTSNHCCSGNKWP